MLEIFEQHRKKIWCTLTKNLQIVWKPEKKKLCIIEQDEDGRLYYIRPKSEEKTSPSPVKVFYLQPGNENSSVFTKRKHKSLIRKIQREKHELDERKKRK